MFCFRFSIHTKNVEPVLCPVHILKALALPCLSNRATLKAPRRCIYHSPPCVDGYNNYTSRGVPVALVLTSSLNLRDSQNVKPKAFRKRLCMYVSRPPVITQRCILRLSKRFCRLVDRRSSVPRAFSIQERRCKDTHLSGNTIKFMQKKCFHKPCESIFLHECLRKHGSERGEPSFE